MVATAKPCKVYTSSRGKCCSSVWSMGEGRVASSVLGVNVGAEGCVAGEWREGSYFPNELYLIVEVVKKTS